VQFILLHFSDSFSFSQHIHLIKHFTGQTGSWTALSAQRRQAAGAYIRFIYTAYKEGDAENLEQSKRHFKFTFQMERSNVDLKALLTRMSEDKMDLAGDNTTQERSSTPQPSWGWSTAENKSSSLSSQSWSK
jgi:hypothetical protein